MSGKHHEDDEEDEDEFKELDERLLSINKNFYISRNEHIREINLQNFDQNKSSRLKFKKFARE